jgi:hypothetical protein
MKALLQRNSIRGFVLAILLMGLIRFVLTVSGVPDSTVKYFSMTAIVIVGTLYFSAATDTGKQRFIAAYLLILPYMVVEVAALGYTWISGQRTIFQADEYSLGFSLVPHMLGHFVGGLTWEPWSVFILMEILWGIGWVLRRATSGREE